MGHLLEPIGLVTHSTEVVPFTSRTRVALAIARALAAGRGHHELSAAHVLLGILREGENPAVAVLVHAGVSLPALRRDVEQLLEPPARPAPRDVTLSLSEGERQLTARADSERVSLDHPFIGTEHFLLALLRDASSAASQLLRRHGLTYEGASGHMAAVIHHHSTPHDHATGQAG